MMRFLMLAVVALAMTGCASNVVTDYNSSVVFGNYSSWAFAGGTIRLPLPHSTALGCAVPSSES